MEMEADDFAEKIRTARLLAGLSPEQIAAALIENAATGGQVARDRFWKKKDRVPESHRPGDRRLAERWFILEWDSLIDFGATDDMKERCREAFLAAFYSDPPQPTD
jgi:hypothetical protein